MVSYEPGETLAHRLDPRSKLLLQVGFAIAVFSVGDPRALAVLAVAPFAGLVLARVSPLAVVRAFWPLLLLLGFGPVFALVAFSPPWYDLGAARRSAVAVGRVLLVVLLSAAYIRSTSARDSRAAVQRTIPGRVGQLFGVGVALTIRFLPVLRRDVGTLWDAIRARGGQRRSALETGRLLAAGGVRRVVRRSDHLALALRARCFAWNPTLPALRFSPRDYPVLALGLALALVPLAQLVVGPG